MNLVPPMRAIGVAIVAVALAASSAAQQPASSNGSYLDTRLQSFEPQPSALSIDAYEQIGAGATMMPAESNVGFGAPPAAPATFPYGAPLVGYEHARTCYPHGYCKQYCSRKARKQCAYWGYPEYFCEPPFGVRSRSYYHTQVQNGLSRQLALYDYDFFPIDSDHAGELKPRGKMEVAKVARLAEMLQDQYAVVTIEATGHANIDDMRRSQVHDHLVALGAPLAIEQIVVGKPAAMGRDGNEAALNYLNQLQNVQSSSAGLAGEGISGPSLYSKPTSNAPTTGGVPGSN